MIQSNTAVEENGVEKKGKILKKIKDTAQPRILVSALYNLLTTQRRW